MQAKQREELAEFAQLEHRAACDHSASLGDQLLAVRRQVREPLAAASTQLLCLSTPNFQSLDALIYTLQAVLHHP